MRQLWNRVALAFLAVLVIALIFAPSYSVTFTEADIKSKVAAQIPHEVKRAGVAISVTSATVDFLATNQIAVEAGVAATGFTLDGVGSVSAKTSVRYEDGRFYLGDLTHDDIQFTFSDSSQETIRDVTNTIRGILEREGAEAKATNDHSKSEKIEKIQIYAQEQLQHDATEALDVFVKNIAIYDMNDQGAAMWLAALSIKTVEINDDQVTAILSFQQLIFRLMIGALTLLLIVATAAPVVAMRVVQWLYQRWFRRKAR